MIHRSGCPFGWCKFDCISSTLLYFSMNPSPEFLEPAFCSFASKLTLIWLCHNCKQKDLLHNDSTSGHLITSSESPCSCLSLFVFKYCDTFEGQKFDFVSAAKESLQFFSISYSQDILLPGWKSGISFLGKS